MVFSMRTLVLKLFNRNNRPSFSYIENDEEITALIDTGAETPVWCSSEEDFLDAYPDAIRQNWDSEIRGFGKEAETGHVYVIPEFKLSDGKESYVICNLEVLVCYHPLIGYDFVMSDTMFSKADTYIHRIGNKYIEIFFEKDKYQCAAKRADGTFSIVTFAQNEN